MSDTLCPFPLSAWSDGQLAVLYSITTTAPNDPSSNELHAEVKAELQRRGAVERAITRTNIVATSELMEDDLADRVGSENAELAGEGA